MPKEITNEIEDIDDDVFDVTDGADASQEAEQSAAAAKSSDAEDVSKPEDSDTESLVRDVVEDGEKSEAEAASSASEDEGSDEQEGEHEEPDNENYSDVPFNKHPRFQEVLGKLKTAETDAQRYKNVETFISDNGLDGEEVKELIEVGGMMKVNPVEAWKRIQPVIQNLLIAAGEILPDDLKTQVQSGELSREAALNVSRARALSQSVDARRQFDEQRSERTQQQTARQAVLGAVSSWEAERKRRDPNFEAKMPDLEREIAWLQAKEGKPRTPEAAKAQLATAYDAVNKRFKTAGPSKQAIKPVNGGQANGSTSGSEKPLSTLDLIRQEVSKRETAGA